MNSSLQFDSHSVRVLDGGLATELERRGCDLSGPLWSAHILDSSPQIVAQVHLDYLRAGADCISTAGYQISALGYVEIGRTASEAADAMRQSVEIAGGAREEYRGESDRRVFVAASLGPYGAALHNGAEFHGRYDISFQELVRFHSERLAIVADTEADMVALETVPSLVEARAITKALEQFPSMAAWVSFTCKDHHAVAHGEPIAQCAALLDDAPQVMAIGVNCTQPRFVSSLIVQIKTASSKPVFVYPNSGELWNAESRSWVGTAKHGLSDIVDYGRLAAEWYMAGAQAVGGCCRTTPAHIRAVRASADAVAGLRLE